MINPSETWHVEVGAEIYETNFEGLVTWISEGNLLRADKVRRGNLRWLEAGKVPTLEGFFNAKDFGTPMPSIEFSTTVVQNETAAETSATQNNFATSQQNSAQFSQFQQTTTFDNLPPTQAFAPQIVENPPPIANVCLMHPDTEPSARRSG